MNLPTTQQYKSLAKTLRYSGFNAKCVNSNTFQGIDIIVTGVSDSDIKEIIFMAEKMYNATNWNIINA
jgi:hypothetical protein